MEMVPDGSGQIVPGVVCATPRVAGLGKHRRLEAGESAKNDADRIVSADRDARLGGVEAALTGMCTAAADARRAIRSARIRSGDQTDAVRLREIRKHLDTARKWARDAEVLAKDALGAKP